MQPQPCNSTCCTRQEKRGGGEGQGMEGGGEGLNGVPITGSKTYEFVLVDRVLKFLHCCKPCNYHWENKQYWYLMNASHCYHPLQTIQLGIITLYMLLKYSSNKRANEGEKADTCPNQA